GRRIAAGRIPKDHGAALFLQAAAVCSFLQASGFWLDEEDLALSVWDVEGGSPRLWLTRTPSAIRRGGPGPAPCAVLAAFLDRLFARGRRLAHPAARGLLERLLAADAPYRRAEFWLASAFRAFPELASARSAAARRRTLGTSGPFCRSAQERARFEQARALLTNREPRILAMDPCGVTGGGALGLTPAPAGLASTVRALRERHARENGGRRGLWIAVEPERWDSLSTRAFHAAALSLSGEVDTIEISGAAAPALLADEWRREIFVPCGTLSASLRFYEKFAVEVREDPSSARLLAETIVSSTDWAAFAADATGDAPLPAPSVPSFSAREPDGGATGETEMLETLAALGTSASGARLSRVCRRRNVARLLESLSRRGDVTREASGSWSLSAAGRRRTRLSLSRRQEICRRWAREEEDPERRIALWLEGEELERALAEAREQISASSGIGAEKWFELSARLCAALPQERPCWLEAIEAERDLSGGRPAEAVDRLDRIERSPEATVGERRAAALRSAEIGALRGEKKMAAGLAAAWRSRFPDAPAQERVRALRLEASGRAREGAQEEALALLDQAERAGASLPAAERVETALARAGVYSLAGRLREEQETYDRWRAVALAEGDDRLAARFLACEALGLSDRREFPRAVSRLEEALAAARDDPVERARLAIDLAATLYHAGRSGRCGA
ncbi:MAG TPA: hypothetical protein VER78_06180, partial [Thermoanaerobaculia bacterium]|nr:hypothetical protein [Thermoanaerobaculia bacterium]